MGALTLGLIVPVGARSDQGVSNTSRRAQSAAPWIAEQLRTVADVREAARALGMQVELVGVPNSDDGEAAMAMLRQRLGHADCVMVVGHGPDTTSGKLHALARSCGLPVAGPDGLAIALSSDKLLARRQLASRNLPVPRTVVLDGRVEQGARELERLGFPCIVKPRRGSLGHGVARVATAEAVRALGETGDTDRLVERELVGREFSVVMLGREILGIAELVRTFTNEGPRTVEMRCPADLDPITRAGIENLARRSCEALGLTRGPLRVDLIASTRHNEAVLEVEAVPPLHRDSVVARVARAAGLPYPELVARVIESSPRAVLRTSTPTLRTGAAPTRAPALHA